MTFAYPPTPRLKLRQPAGQRVGALAPSGSTVGPSSLIRRGPEDGRGSRRYWSLSVTLLGALPPGIPPYGMASCARGGGNRSTIT